ncbi:MAG: N-acetylmuramoyl-L-alanine amidase [Candidatus Zixiibacteriota bacterium]
MSVSNDFKAEEKRRLCALVIGHKKNSPGAASSDGSISEFVFNEQLAVLIEGKVTQADVQRVYRRTLESLPHDINNLNPDFIISLHCNSFHQKATGTEVLYYHKSERGKGAAAVLQKHLVGHLGLKNRGTKPKNAEERGGYLLKYTKAPCIISEPFFISNNDDLARAQEDFAGLAAACAAAIDEIALDDEISGWKS